MCRSSSWIACVTIILATVGCSSEAVKEDRSINFSHGGDGVGFQHGEEGVFVASDDGDKLEKIFDPGEETIAVSSPLWSPVDKRLIFTSARPARAGRNRVVSEEVVSEEVAGNRVADNITAWDANPEGRSFWPGAIVYTCMLRPAPKADDSPPPIALFEASCNHAGYVAANLAVRWHPSGERILYVDQTAEGQHSLFEFDLLTKKSRRILHQSAAALIFDWTPSGSHLVCVLAGGREKPRLDGIWVRPEIDGDEGGNGWWRVPQSGDLAKTDSDALLERLRSTRPTWTEDDRRFAFVVNTATAKGSGGKRDDGDAILVVDATSRKLTRLYEGPDQIRDLHWHPGSRKLGFVEGKASASVRVIDETGSVSATINPARVRRFAGWNHDGTRLAYITPESATDSGKHWALLFPRVHEARDCVYVADDAGVRGAEVVHSGVRITFPQWSPKDDVLSLWGTYAPSHRSWLSTFLPWTLRPGDPAAILDCDTGTMKWMAVNAHEEAQVGHYYLLNRDYEQAWQWYEKSAGLRQPAGPIKLGEIDLFMRRARIHQDSSFFEYFCLTKLGRHDEAADRLGQFRQSMSFDTRDVGDLFQQPGLEDEERQAEVERMAEFVTPLIQNAYITEVFLSLGAATDGVEFFQRELEAATSDAERLACGLCLSQVLLAGDERQAYAELMLETLAPLLMKMHQSDGMLKSNENRGLLALRRRVEQGVLSMGGGLALLPMMSHEFTGGFPEDQLRTYLARWQALRDKTKDDKELLSIDLILLAILKQLGADDEAMTVKHRIENNSESGRDFLPKDPEDVDQAIEQFRTIAG